MVEKKVRKAATLILLRDSEDGLELLMLKRGQRDGKSSTFLPNTWVFPGGVVEQEDYPKNAKDDHDMAAKQAAVRETFEEANIQVNVNELVYFSHWTTPAESHSKRYATWFFAASCEPEQSFKVCGEEIVEGCWMTPHNILEAHAQEEMSFLPPTWVTIDKLLGLETTDEALAILSFSPPQVFNPRPVLIDGGICMLYEGDAGYDARDIEAKGDRHRFWMGDNQGNWTYENIQGAGYD